jgi:hypothetical protein
VKRGVLVGLGGYLLLAVGNRVAEAAGVMRCGCAEDCWCKRPGLSLFRWVFPWRHRGAHTAEEKAQLQLSEA